MPTDIFSALGVIVSGLSALLAGYYAKRTIDHAQKAQLFAAQADEHAKHANVISANTWLDQYLCNVRLWADEV